jgi:hypothetical protein
MAWEKSFCTRGDGCVKSYLSIVLGEIFMWGNLPYPFGFVERVLPWTENFWIKTNMDLGGY